MQGLARPEAELIRHKDNTKERALLHNIQKVLDDQHGELRFDVFHHIAAISVAESAGKPAALGYATGDQDE